MILFDGLSDLVLLVCLLVLVYKDFKEKYSEGEE